MSSVSRSSSVNFSRCVLRAGFASGQMAGALHLLLARLAALNAASSSGVRLILRGMGVIDLDPHNIHGGGWGVNSGSHSIKPLAPELCIDRQHSVLCVGAIAVVRHATDGDFELIALSRDALHVSFD